MIIEALRYGLHPRDIEFIIQKLKNGAVGILPTDSVYTFCCLSDQKAAFESICALKRIDPKDALMSIVCKDLSQASDYFGQWPTPVFRILNKNLPGAFTFILHSGHRAPSFLKNKRKTLGLRIPEHLVIKSIMDQLDIPLIVSSVKNEEAADEYFTVADEMTKMFEPKVDFIVIDEIIAQEGSTIIDLTGDDPQVIRQGVHELQM